jgi:predicted porin
MDGDSMKKSTILLTFPFLGGIAHAQSSTTLYGMVDSGIVYINNQSGHSNVQTVTGQTNGSRFGFRGAEDLGGGMKAIFTLENGFDTSNGKLLQGSRLFGRQAYVGLSGSFGQVTLGRQYDQMTEYVGAISATSIWAWLGTHQGDFDNLNGNIRTNNSIKYTTPKINGFEAGGIYAPGGVAGSLSSSTIYTLGATYSNGPFTAAVAYDHINDPSLSGFDGTIAPGNPGYTSPIKSPVYSGFASAQTLQIFGTGISYSFGAGKVGFVYTNTRFGNVLHTPTTPFSGTAVFNSFEANVRYYVIPTFMIAAAIDYTKAEKAKYLQINVGPDYFLSKSTDLNLAGVWQHASGIDSTGKPAVAAIGSLGQSSTPNQLAVKLSLRHRF